MKYPKTNDPPGVNVYRMRQALELSQRGLADKCHPALDHTTIMRLENNQGYTQDTLERVAKALGTTVQNLFLPPELFDWGSLPPETRQRFASMIEDAAIAAKYRRRA